MSTSSIREPLIRLKRQIMSFGMKRTQKQHGHIEDSYNQPQLVWDQGVIVVVVINENVGYIGSHFEGPSSNSSIWTNQLSLLVFPLFYQIVVWDSINWKRERSTMLQISADWIPTELSETFVQFHQDQEHFLVVHETQIAIYETTKLECVKQVCSLSLSCHPPLPGPDLKRYCFLSIPTIINYFLMSNVPVDHQKLLCANFTRDILLWLSVDICRYERRDRFDTFCFRSLSQIWDRSFYFPPFWFQVIWCAL